MFPLFRLDEHTESPDYSGIHGDTVEVPGDDRGTRPSRRPVPPWDYVNAPRIVRYDHSVRLVGGA